MRIATMLSQHTANFGIDLARLHAVLNSDLWPVPLRVNPFPLKWLDNEISMNVRSIWRSGCTYSLGTRSQHEDTWSGPEDDSRVMLQSPHYQ
jgi:hypothetical protein